MCHQSGGLIASALEGAGVSTVSLTLKPEITEQVGTPRSAYVRFPLGRPFGEPGKPDQQLRVLRAVLGVLAEASEPGTMVELPFRWRRM